MGGKNTHWGAVPWAVAIYLDGCIVDSVMDESRILRDVSVVYGSNCLQNSMNQFCIDSPLAKHVNIISRIDEDSSSDLRIRMGGFFEWRCKNRDIALLELALPIDNDSNYACLPSRSISEFTSMLATFGWGADRWFCDDQICYHNMPYRTYFNSFS
ncbi:unnamed protein product [Anisakis simplex]|uniref:Leishmanolysin-like peptidase n=1 Tax=Anisakis simplex TaxID=6269 RepID=A0A0M3K8B8_ANISI|nr:unnamed protein product [Anisakis simplex]